MIYVVETINEGWVVGTRFYLTFEEAEREASKSVYWRVKRLYKG